MDSFTRCIPKAIILKTSSENICPRSKPQVCAWSGVKSLTCCCYCCYFASVVSDSVRPHRRQPTRLPRPWDSPGKNTGVGCHFPLQCMKVKSESEVAQLCPTLVTPWTVAHQASSSMGFSRQEYWSGVPLPSPSVSLESPNTRTKIGLSITVILCYYPMQQEKMRKKTIS